MATGRRMDRGEHPLARRRTAAGISQDELARRVGISRQALSAIEAGRHSPRVGVALALADALGCAVEELFAPERPAAGPFVEAVGFEAGRTARAVLAHISGREVAWPLDVLEAHGSPTGAADALVEAGAPGAGSIGPELSVRRARVLRRLRRGGNTVLLSGCDPALGILAAHARRWAPVEACWWPAGNAKALGLLGARCAHGAGIHGSPRGEEAAPDDGYARFVLGGFEMGLLTAPGNPLRVLRPEDLGRPGLRVVNRERGAGARLVLDRLLERAGVDPSALVGYDHEVASHGAVAASVALGAADVGVAPVAVAEAHGLGVVPIAWERSELWVAREALGDPALSALLEALCSRAFALELGALGGYETAETGRRVA